MPTTKYLRLVAYSAALISCLANASHAQVQPLVPFQTNFSHSQHHWILWTPKHPVYEAVEVRSSDNPQSPDGTSVRVFFTERAGAKNQVYYFNEEAVAKHFRLEAHYRSIEYRAEGQPGKPLDLYVKFKDKDDRLVELTMQFEKGQELSAQYAGLTNQMGHGADFNFLVFFREKAASVARTKLLIGGEDFSLTPENAPQGSQLFVRSGYRSNIYVATIAYGKGSFRWSQNNLTSSFGPRTFKKASESDKEIIYRSNLVEDRTMIELVTNSKGEIRQYRHLLDAHVFQIEFEPALPSIASARTGQSVKYSVSLDSFKNLVQGLVSTSKENDVIQLDWRHLAPPWTKDYYFTSIIKPNAGGGYDLELVRKK